MNNKKKEAIEFCLNKHVSNKIVDILLTTILTFGLAIIIFPIIIWLIYRYIKAKKEVAILKNQISNDYSFFNKVCAEKTFNSVVLDVNGTFIEIPQLYLWMSNYSKKDLVNILNS